MMQAEKQGDIGIVLSGGGTRGIAHIGALRALAEEGIVPGRVAGASTGAIVGALYAAGYSPAEMLEFFEKKNPFRLSRVSITKPGIIDMDKVKSDFEEYFPENSFEALGKELHVVATDLTRGESVVFRSGPLVPAVLASSSYPVMFTPLVIDDRIFADGGILNNFPIELLEGRCRVRLGVYVGSMRELTRADLGSALSVLKRALEVGMFRASEAKFATCDAVVHPAGLGRISLFDTKHYEMIEKAGYEAARGLMPVVLEVLKRAGV